MKTSTFRLSLVCVTATLLAAPVVAAQRQADQTKSPTSKIYVAETKGETQIQNGERLYAVRQATVFDASGTVIETKADAHNALVYSNGTGLFIDQVTRVQINRFAQEPFNPERHNQLGTPYEPSVSQSNVFISFGAVGVCTSQLISGSTMLYSTPHATINIRGGRVVIESTSEFTTVDLVEGDLTIRSGEKDVGGRILRAGERAVIRAGINGADALITIQPIPTETAALGERRVEMACNARRSVSFGVIVRKAGEGSEASAGDGTATEGELSDEAAGAAGDTQEITASPTVPSNPPNNIVISPDRLPGT